MNSILIVEDDPAILLGLEEIFILNNYNVLTSMNGKDGLSLALSNNPDLIILDINLPYLSGFDVCQHLRDNNFSNPIIMLTSRHEQIDKVVGLEIGADDYITKPFDPREVLARVRANLRRTVKNSISGLPITPNGQYKRKLLSIMFTDMKDYSKKMNLDENLAMKLLEIHNKIMNKKINKHGGRIVEIIGDAFLASFESAVDAVSCAIDIQKEFNKYNIEKSSKKKIEIRIGIHLGDVIEFENKLKGDTLNIAARIQQNAVPGSVDISESVYDVVKNKVKYSLEKKGKQKFKNIKKPITVYNVQV